MRRTGVLAGCLGLMLALPGPGLADEWKDESGKGRERPERRAAPDWRRDERGGFPPQGGFLPPFLAQPNIPPGHQPPPRECRLWFPDRPPGQQPPPHRC
jgi:hypothetical protein